MHILQPAFADDAWPLSYDIARFDALLFDLDGTLVDTMPLHGLAYAAVFKDLGYSFTMDDYIAHVGPPARVAIHGFAEAAGMGSISDAQVSDIHRAKKRKFKDILTTRKAPALAAAALLERHVGQVKMALVSSGNREGVEAILQTMGWAPYFSLVISGDDVANGKPHPEPYLQAAQALGVDAAKCLVFEDTPSGIEAGRAAGMSVIDVTQPGAIILAGGEV